MSPDALRRACGTGRVFPVFQGVYDLSTGLLIGVEVLARWRQEDGRLIPPGRFIPMAESTGVIDRVTRLIWSSGMSQVAERWPDGGALAPWVSLNVSSSSLASVNHMMQTVGDALPSRMLPSRVVLEVSEGQMVDKICLDQLAEVREQGVRVAIDDFGKGWSSLARLAEMPMDILKMDQSFVRGLDEAGRGRAIFQAVVYLGRALGLSTIVEGVETQEEFAEVHRFAPDAVQGFLFSKPTALAAVRPIVSTRSMISPSPVPG